MTDREIELNNSNEVCLVDAEDYPLLSRHNWTAVRHRHCLYASIMIGKKMVYIHRLIMGPANGVEHHDFGGYLTDKGRIL